MEKQLETIKKEFHLLIESLEDNKRLQEVRTELFGKNGVITKATKEFVSITKEERPKIGKLINEVKQSLEEALISKEIKLESQSKQIAIDITTPGIRPTVGHLHPITQAIWDIGNIFSRIGFEITDTREIETDWYAFGALNFPENHPARDEWETFFVEEKNIHIPEGEKVVLTPHTSSAQAHVMQTQKPPIRNITISKCYRRQADVSHLQMFHQFEGIFVDELVSIAHLKGVLDYFATQFFGSDRSTRIRPYDFRFTEPSFEVDISCGNCGGKARLSNGQVCRLCKQGWLELGGAGMIHPNVLKNGGIDPDQYSGFAFGWGVERVWMMKGGIKLPDIRAIYSNDLRFNNQF